MRPRRSDKDLIGRADGAEAMGDDKAGAVGHEALEGFLDEPFGGGIDAGGGLVEDQNGRVFQERAGDADALFFTDAELDAAFADAGVVAVRQAGDELVTIGGARGGDAVASSVALSLP